VPLPVHAGEWDAVLRLVWRIVYFLVCPLYRMSKPWGMEQSWVVSFCCGAAVIRAVFDPAVLWAWCKLAKFAAC